MTEKGRFTAEEIAFVARLQAGPAPATKSRYSEAVIFGILVSVDITTWAVVTLRGVRALLGPV